MIENAELKQRELDKIADDWHSLRVPYDPRFLSEFKSYVPSQYRAWDGDDKVWYVSPDFIETAAAIAKRYFYRDPQTGLTWLDSWRVLHLREGAPSRLIQCSADCLLANESVDSKRLRIEVARDLLLTL